MVSSDERREVAERLRDWADRYPQGDFTWGVLGSVHYRIDGADTRPSSNQEVLYMLADLIDHTCHMVDTDHEYEDSIRCDVCQMTFNRPWEPFRFCPNCGARVVRDDD